MDVTVEEAPAAAERGEGRDPAEVVEDHPHAAQRGSVSRSR
jgi:hypothetical protein